MFEDKRVNSTSIINIYTPHSELKYLHVHIQFLRLGARKVHTMLDVYAIEIRSDSSN